LDAANQALGRLDGITLLLPDPDQFLYTYIRKEAVLSSQIEGTQSSLSDLLLFENEAAPGVPRHDTEETANYIAAMNHGVNSIASDTLPVSNRLLREVHARLLSTGRGADKSPGEFRRDQNWLGGSRPANARYVPPPWTEVVPLMTLRVLLEAQPMVAEVLLDVTDFVIDAEQLAQIEEAMLEPPGDALGRAKFHLNIVSLREEQGRATREIISRLDEIKSLPRGARAARDGCPRRRRG